MYLIFDGGNGGPTVNKGYGSFKVFENKGGELLHHTDRHTFPKPMTNNEAEYMTLILALQWISDNIDDPEFVYGALEIEGDSELVRQQILGKWRVKHTHLKPLYKQAKSLINLFTRYTYNHISRTYVVEMLGH